MNFSRRSLQLSSCQYGVRWQQPPAIGCASALSRLGRPSGEPWLTGQTSDRSSTFGGLHRTPGSVILCEASAGYRPKFKDADATYLPAIWHLTQSRQPMRKKTTPHHKHQAPSQFSNRKVFPINRDQRYLQYCQKSTSR